MQRCFNLPCSNTQLAKGTAGRLLATIQCDKIKGQSLCRVTAAFASVDHGMEQG
jgi:hypothetical protein